jgi:hypothetical protein
MSDPTQHYQDERAVPARTHAQAAELFRRPFAPAAVGFRVIERTELDGDPLGGAVVATYVRAQSVMQRLTSGAPGRWRQRFTGLSVNGVPFLGPTPQTPPPLMVRGRLLLHCALTIWLPFEEDGPDVEAVYEDVGQVDAREGDTDAFKALYSDARKRSAVPAGIGAYLYTSIPRIVLPIGPGSEAFVLERGTFLAVPPGTERVLRRRYREHVSRPEVVRHLGAILRHGEVDDDLVQGDGAETARAASSARPLPPAPAPSGPAAASAAPAAAAAEAVAAASDGPRPGAAGRTRQPPPPPVRPAEGRIGAGADPASGLLGALTPLTAEQQAHICERARELKLTRGALANVVFLVSGGHARSEDVAGRLFDENLLARTPAHLYQAILDALERAHDGAGGEAQLPLTVSAGSRNGSVPVDFQGLGGP